MKYLISALLLTFSFAPLAAYADIAPEPTLFYEGNQEVSPVVADPSQVTEISAPAPTPTPVPVAQPASLALVWIVIVCMGAVILALAIKTWKK